MPLIDNKCSDKIAKDECVESGGFCRTEIDGYYIEVAINVVYGIIWYFWAKRMLKHLQDLDRSEWHVLSKRTDVENLEESPLNDYKNKI